MLTLLLVKVIVDIFKFYYIYFINKGLRAFFLTRLIKKQRLLVKFNPL